MKTIIEPFRIKSVEPIHFTSAGQRRQLLQEAAYNPFLLKARDVIIDLLTDSGTGAMSSAQWAGIMNGDESYAGSDSFFRFEEAVRNLTAMPYIIPVHQGRAAEKILFTVKGGKGKYVLSNTLFDTTRANIEFSGATGVDLLCPEGHDPAVAAPFKGNIDLDALTAFIGQHDPADISMVILTVTNNSGGGQPVSMENIKAARAICNQHHIPFFIDCCRFAENCYFIKHREAGYAHKTVLEIAQELFSYADGCTMSAKKDAFANIGGFLALHDAQLAEECRNLLIITEGFPTYGGLAGRDLDAIAIGLTEIVDEDYLKYRIRSIEYIGEKLESHNIPFLKPTGGHAIYLDAKAFLDHIPAHQYPGQALSCALYLEGGVRGVEIGSVMFGKYDADGKLTPSAMELVRLAIPRRTYTQSHMDYLAEVIIAVYENRSAIKGLKITYETPFLRHFTAKFETV
ncbi:tryptophanase [Mucilaginibacter sp. dw_454]|uniref:tryptophanase n=1 Tax=Mucilaginibacter sp. dw_454 TaxID=2720079 RepID=UPI001BD2F03C|nr:tryptophanase [Mucilaginibacter sp. dw_454]